MGFFWRLSFLLLPWQIRWFSEGPFVNGFPWETGRISAYLSWIPMMITIIFSFFSIYNTSTVTANIERKKYIFLLLGLFFIFVPSLSSMVPRATIQWSIQIFILFFFFLSLFRLHISSRSIVMWFVISLIPHAVLGIWQFVDQFVYGSKWFGMATQDPMIKGVSVVEFSGRRLLRAYGGFPHPNIFGGWLAIGFIASMRFVITEKRRIFWGAVFFLFLVSLFLTFARGAWIAAYSGFILMCFFLFRSHARRTIFFILLSSLVVFGLAFWQKEIVVTRVRGVELLETQSREERLSSVRNGFILWRQHPFFGVGPGVAAFALGALPPHFVPLLILDEVGILGCIGLLFIFGFLLRVVGSSVLRFESTMVPVIALIISSFFDHYLWSFWAGQSLLFVTVAPFLFYVLSHENPLSFS